MFGLCVSEVIMSKFANPLKNLSARKQQFVLLGGAVFVVFLIYLFFVSFMGGTDVKPAQLQTDLQSKAKSMAVTPGSPLNPADSWMGGAGKDVADIKIKSAAQERTNDGFQQAIKDLQGKFAAAEQDKYKAQPSTVQPQAPLAADPSANTTPSPLVGSKAQLSANSMPALPGQGKSDPNAPWNRLPPAKAGQTGEMPPGVPNDFSVPSGPGLLRVSLRDDPGSPQSAAPYVARSADNPATPSTNSSFAKENAPKNLDSYLPVSFVRAVVLGGIDAPTGGQSQSNPLPVLLQLTDLAVLPNRYRANVQECLIIGEAYGDMSSERAYIRTTTLSCITKDRQSIEVPLNGSVFDETGKVGMRGRLVSKQGTVLANALLAGIASGIGQGFQNKYTTTSISPLGSTQSVQSDKAFEAGIGSGVGRAMDRLANYYISVAEKMFPIIEVDSGRIVDVVIKKGVSLEAPLNAARAADGGALPTSRSLDRSSLINASIEED
jgi:conjugal transfer pilus assembly protein TraB